MPYYVYDVVDDFVGIHVYQALNFVLDNALARTVTIYVEGHRHYFKVVVTMDNDKIIKVKVAGIIMVS